MSKRRRCSENYRFDLMPGLPSSFARMAFKYCSRELRASKGIFFTLLVDLDACLIEPLFRYSNDDISI